MATASHRGTGGSYVQEVARNETLFPVRAHRKDSGLPLSGVALDLPKLYLYDDPRKPGGVRVILTQDDVQRDGMTMLDLQAILSLAVQRAVDVLEDK